MLRPALTITALLAITTAVVAQNDPIASRRQLMKDVGAAAKVGSQMAKGEAPFDLAKAQDVLKTFGNAAANMHNYFPKGSETGGQTTASPEIWKNEADFRARFDAWGSDIKKAASETKDLTTFRAEFGTVMKACGACHNTYRIKT